MQKFDIYDTKSGTLVAGSVTTHMDTSGWQVIDLGIGVYGLTHHEGWDDLMEEVEEFLGTDDFDLSVVEVADA